jgi:hypothetical protein
MSHLGSSKSADGGHWALLQTTTTASSCGSREIPAIRPDDLTAAVAPSTPRPAEMSKTATEFSSLPGYITCTKSGSQAAKLVDKMAFHS